ncbi:50S ribosomal protein L24 [Synechococcus sp. H65.1]|uniref:50S ribosomal protein L24 n=1 Tax=unclassified Synechococcus TaxID=2626047 RepID=UPI0039C1A15F
MVRPLKPSQIRRLIRQPGVRKHRNSLRYKMRIKKGDLVQVISGDDKGKVGEVLRVFPERNMVLVEGVNIVTYHRKPQREGEKGRIETKEAPIHACKVMLYSKKHEVASRVGYQITADGRKVRVLKKTGEILD